jgi:hypothetical protein
MEISTLRVAIDEPAGSMTPRSCSNIGVNTVIDRL